MNANQLVFFSVPGLRPGDVRATQSPTLHAWANQGAIAELVPSFPCVTSPVQASFLTGEPAAKHGVVSNGFMHRERETVEFWVGRNDVVSGRQIWNKLKERRQSFTSAVWHAQNIKGAAADFIVTPAPIHESDGTTKLWCYSKPESLYPELLESLGHFPLQHYWGPLANIESTRWILRGASWLTNRHSPNFQWIYIPHLDYAAQKFGPHSPQAMQAVKDLDQQLGEFAQRTEESGKGKHPVFLVAGEYALTDVVGAIHPNRILREAGLLKVREQGGAEFLDFSQSRAFAMVDHQFAHVYLKSVHDAERVRDLFRSVPNIADVVIGTGRAKLGLDHPRSGEAILVSDDAHWFAYYWWLDDDAAPPFARTVDIHQKPGYDPVELFFDPVRKGIPLDSNLVKGSHGVPVTAARHRTALLCSVATSYVESGHTYRDTDIARISLGLLGAGVLP